MVLTRQTCVHMEWIRGFNINSKYKKYHMKWIELYQSGMSARDISNIYTCSRGAVNYILGKFKIPKRQHIYIESRQIYHMFDVIDNEVNAYWLGFIYADGSVSSGSCLRIELKPSSTPHLSKLSDIFNARIVHRSKYNKRMRRSYNTVYLTLHSKHMVDELIGHGIYKNKTYVDSDEVLNHVPEELMHHFIRGYFDGDGGVGMFIPSRGRCAINMNICGVYMFLSSIQKIIVHRSSMTNGSLFKHGSIYRLAWGGTNNAHKLYDYLYRNATVYMECKEDVFTRYFQIRDNINTVSAELNINVI